MLTGIGGRRLLLTALGSTIVLLAAAGCLHEGGSPEAHGLTFDGDRAYEFAVQQCDKGPRPAGSEAGWATCDYIIAHLEKLGWQVETQEFEYRGVPLRNIIGKAGHGPVVILGAHYDTRPVADRDPQHPAEPIIGGNDGASGVAVLLELANVLPRHDLKNEVWLAFFDAEDMGRLQGWPWCVGSTHMAETLTVQPLYVIVVDMVGDSQQELYYERNSDGPLRQSVWRIASELGYEQFIAQERHALIDDHLPFRQRGVPAIDIIDFDYPWWHTVEDTCDKISAGSLERVGRVLEELVTGSQ
jgi:glutaminyl-peptide cyclotransferase